MKKQMILNACLGYSPVHLSPGMWRFPGDESVNFSHVEHWVALAKLLEAGKFDAMFFADTVGVSDVHKKALDSAVRNGMRLPRHDPMMIIPAMAAHTRHLGFAATATLSYENPYLFARRISTLDHLTGGRMGWNIVTGYLESGAKAVGQGNVNAHDLRYDIADEFMEVVYKLWEGSWDDGAVVHDREKNIFALPEKVRKIVHSGTHYNVDGVHMTEPSPQRTPVLFQAGASDRGREFAARHAEALFVAGTDYDQLASVVADIRARAEKYGRNPRDIKFLLLSTAIAGSTDEAAWAKVSAYQKYVNLEAALTSLSAWTGIDLSLHDMDGPFPKAKMANGIHSFLDSFKADKSGKEWTIREAAAYITLGGRGPLMVGNPATIADAMQEWIDRTDIDGFNLSYAVMPNDFRDFIDLVVPELQRRGVFKQDYATGTLRTKLAGRGPYLPEEHEGRKHRFATPTEPRG